MQEIKIMGMTEDFAFYSLTLGRHDSPETRSYLFGVEPDNDQGHKAIRFVAFRTLLWELVQEGRQDYGSWYLKGEEKSNYAPDALDEPHPQ